MVVRGSNEACSVEKSNVRGCKYVAQFLQINWSTPSISTVVVLILGVMGIPDGTIPALVDSESGDVNFCDNFGRN